MALSFSVADHFLAIARQQQELGDNSVRLTPAPCRSVKQFAEAFRTKRLPLDILVCNAAAWMPPDTMSPTEDGFEVGPGLFQQSQNYAYQGCSLQLVICRRLSLNLMLCAPAAFVGAVLSSAWIPSPVCEPGSAVAPSRLAGLLCFLRGVTTTWPAVPSCLHLLWARVPG